jgi:transposase-like protein
VSRDRPRGTLVNVMLSETRDMAASEAFFRSAKAVIGATPARVTTDGHDSYLRAIRIQLGPHVRHRTSQYLNNRIEQDHRGIKSRYGPMRGFEAVSRPTSFAAVAMNSGTYFASIPGFAKRYRRIRRRCILHGSRIAFQ